MGLIRKIERFIRQNNLLDTGRRYLVALSGGADSVCLLITLQELGFQIEAAHCNFHLRGEESDRDEAFCEALCNDRNIPFHRAHFNTRDYSRLHKVSIEMAARKLRYKYFHDLAESLELQGVCVAHHADDNAETILLNLIRGTGLRGLRGMQPKRGLIIRPMLAIRRSEVLEYLAMIGQTYVTDSTNFETDYTRNKIRLQLLPLLTDMNPSIVTSLCDMGRHLAGADALLENVLAEATDQIVSDSWSCSAGSQLRRIDLYKLLSTPAPSYVLHHILSPYGFNGAQVEEMLAAASATSGRQWFSGDYAATLDRQAFVVSSESSGIALPMAIPMEGRYRLSEDFLLIVEKSEKDEGFVLNRGKDTVSLDASTIAFPLRLRRVSHGDRFVPFGMKGSKLVSDYLTDCKKSLAEKQAQLVLEDATGRIVWLLGERLDNHFAITPETREVIVMSLKRES